MKKRTHPMPWRFSTVLRCVVDADGWEIDQKSADRAIAAGSTLESPVSRAERAVVKAAMDIYLRGGFCDVNLHRSLERLEAAKAKARRKP